MIDFKKPFKPQKAIDWQQSPTLVIESDDWGACEYAPTQAVRDILRQARPPGPERPTDHAKLESPGEIDALGNLLLRYPGSDGIPATLTAFFCLANPDYSRIRESEYRDYFDIPIDRGFPPMWEGKGVVETWRRWVAKGIVSPEFHTRLHHTHAENWMALLRGSGPSTVAAHARFEKEIYWLGRHDPEYSGMTPLTMNRWIAPAVATFERLFGFAPEAAVSSDATPLTEILWAAHGIRTFCLRNFSIPGNPPMIYHTKPWNNQDASTPMGAWNPETDVVYLNRNIFFEPAIDPDYSFDRTLEQIFAVWERNEPAILSSHRINYASWERTFPERGLAELEKVLETISKVPGIRFLSTREVAAVYRTGYACRGDRKRVYSELTHAE